MPTSEATYDPRRRGFRTRRSVAEAIAWIDARTGPLGPDAVSLREAAGRVLAEAVVAEVDVPPFDRAAMDGYALRGEETFGADVYAPAVFRVIGEARPGQPFGGPVRPGEAVEIATGAPMPEGADAVAMVESTARDKTTVRVFEATPPLRHVGATGEDLRAGSLALERGRILRPQDLGLLSGLGRSTVAVVRRPSVAIVVTGDELLPAGTSAKYCKIPDMNSVMLEALVRRDGGWGETVGPLPDDPSTIREALRDTAQSADLVLVVGGSSTGPEDHAPRVVEELGRLWAHGLALRPASPAGLGEVGGRLVVLLPGNPVSCLCAYDFLAGRAVRRLAGLPSDWPYRPRRLPLAAKVVSALGRVDYVRAQVEGGAIVPIASGGASILSSTTKADGFVVVPEDREGEPAGAVVTLWQYDAFAAVE